jgi:gag-polyprotein putative aspartyl protease
MVDTSASAIALKPEDAAMLGIRPSERDYVAPVKIANGVIQVAPVELDTVEIEDLEVHNVAAMGAAGRRCARKPARPVVLKAAAAVRICGRQAGAGTVANTFRNHSQR